MAAETEDWNEFDEAARMTLEPHHRDEFHRYREQLRREEYAWEDDARDILAGFIWDNSEGDF